MASESLEKYIELKKQIGALEKELDALKDDVFQSVASDGGEVAGEGYPVRSYKTPKYSFSEDYEAKNAELKELRKSEIDSGAATVSGYSEYVKITFKKAKE